MDAWAETVRVRLSDTRCASDLHAADGRCYHDDCRKKFIDIKRFLSSSLTSDEDRPFNLLSNLFGSNHQRMWTSVDLEQEYKGLGGSMLTRKKIVERLLSDKKNDVILL